MPKIAAFIPVYKVPKRAVSLVKKLSAEAFPDSCVYLVVDGETTPEIASALTQIRDLPRVTIVEGNPHWGKALALNHAIASVQVENLVFFDNDITVPDDITIFATCLSLLQQYDIVEMPKEGVGKGPLAAMVKFEFLANIIGAKVYADIVGQCPSINGAAFCVRRALFDRLNGFAGVVNEDVDFAARAYLAGARFGIEPSLHVYDDVPETISAWYKQRKRWAVNVGLWGKAYVGKFAHVSSKSRLGMALSSIVFPLPLVTGIFAALSLDDLVFLKPVNVGGLVLPLLGLASFVACSVWYKHLAKKFGQGFSFLFFILYSFIYLPVWGASSAIGTVMARLDKIPPLDWHYVSPSSNQPPT